VVDKTYKERNIASANRYIEAFERRIANAETTGEDVGELRKHLKGYQDTRSRLLKA